MIGREWLKETRDIMGGKRRKEEKETEGRYQ